MIEKLKTLEDDEIDMSVGAVNTRFADTELVRKINELIDAVNNIQKEREAERFEIQEWIAIIGDLRKQVRELQETRSENVQPDAESRSENVQNETPRCPFCGKELSYAQEIDGGFEILSCDCSHGIWLFGNDKMWCNLEKLITKLDRTRKALDKAKWWLNEIVESHRYTPISTAEMALKEITALEQKDK